MTETKIKLDPPATEVTRFFENKLEDLKCEACGTDLWSVMTNSEKYVTGFSVTDSTGYETFKIPVSIISCANCGNMKTFSMATIISWLEANPNG